MGEEKVKPKRWAGVFVDGVLYGPSWEDYVASLTPPPNSAISSVNPAQDSLQSGQVE